MDSTFSIEQLKLKTGTGHTTKYLAINYTLSGLGRLGLETNERLAMVDEFLGLVD